MALTLLGAAAAQGATLQPVGDFDEPIFLTSDPGEPSRLFVVERPGKVVSVEGGVEKTFADISSLVSTVGEGGLLSIAMAPDFDSSGRFYVDYTGKTEPGEIHVAEMRASGGTAPLSSLKNLLTIPHPGDKNHNGGQLQFGPEGDLYVSTGDGGGANDVHHNAQDLESLLGKILRLEPAPGSVPPYEVPSDNPFVGEAGARGEIWSYGLRNPFRFSFDKTTGAMLIGDVGQDAREEVDYATAPLFGAGANYGWNCREGLIAGPGTDPGCAGSEPSDFVNPVFEYPHEDPGGGKAFGSAIIGGYVAREPTLTELSGRYVYGDLESGGVRSLDLRDPFASDRSEGIAVPNLNSLGEDSAGHLYAISGDGPVYRILASPLIVPPVISSPRTLPFVGIKGTRRVERGGRATITVFLSPCVRSQATAGVVVLRSGQRRLGRKHLSRVCTASFRPRIRHRDDFRAQLLEDSTYLGAESRQLTIKLRHRAKHRPR